MHTSASGLAVDPYNLEAERDASRHDACKHGAHEIQVSVRYIQCSCHHFASVVAAQNAQVVASYMESRSDRANRDPAVDRGLTLQTKAL